ncbi:MAG: Usg family protein [Proteobacteria bacterium]|nr:Usg family protein [Pseudomonadota bacterium]
MQNEELALRLRGWRLATAEVLYYLPDHPSLLQSFTWQTLDLAPAYPRIHRFLDFWRREIDAVIHSVQLATGETLAPAKMQSASVILHH